jgi:hypothetical protein
MSADQAMNLSRLAVVLYEPTGLEQPTEDDLFLGRRPFCNQLWLRDVFTTGHGLLVPSVESVGDINRQRDSVWLALLVGVCVQEH